MRQKTVSFLMLNRFHFKGITHLSCFILTHSSSPNINGIAIASGILRISKFNERGQDAKNTVCIFLGLIRMANAGTDVLITLNQLLEAGIASSSAPLESVKDGALALSIENFTELVTSFQVSDWNLFG